MIPAWTTECEEHDAPPGGLCAGVGCLRGNCWKAYTAQLIPIDERNGQLAVLRPFRNFHQELTLLNLLGGWLQHAVSSFQTLPPLHGGEAIESTRLIKIQQGWDVTPRETAAHIESAVSSDVTRYVVSYKGIDQEWEPRALRYT